MKVWKMLIALLAVESFLIFPAFAGTWNHDSKGWWYQMSDGSYPADTWQEIDEKWYLFDDNGYMKTGWTQCEDKWYYCKLNGSLATDQWINGIYYVGADGAMYIDTTTPDGKKVDSTGTLINEQKADYSAYIGEYTDLEDYKKDVEGINTFTISWLTITDIHDNKVYGTCTYGYKDWHEEHFENGVEINGNNFSTEGMHYDYTYAEKPEGVPCFSTYTFAQENGRNVIIRDDGTIFYRED